VGPNAGSSNGGSGVAGAANNAGSGSPNGGGSGVAGAMHVGGVGGKVPDPADGGAGQNSLACSATYAGPSGGPRADGPMNLQGCAAIADEVVLARYKDRSARVPQGFYYEPTENITFWNEPCSESEQETVTRGAPGGMGTLLGSYESEWFYEAVYCSNDSVRRIQRNLRCDYFDGSKLANATPERVAFLASLLWWGDNGNVDGSATLGYTVVVGDATDVIDLCTVRVTYGDFGLCDEVRLESTKHRLEMIGVESGVPQFRVKLGTPEVIRTLRGTCH